MTDESDTPDESDTDNIDAAITETPIPEDVIRAKAKWEIEEAERRLKIEEDKARKALDQPLSALAGLPEDLLRAKIVNELSLADRRMKLEELQAEHEMALESQIENFKEQEAMRLNAIVTAPEDQHWIRKYWRAAAGWTYLFICLFDFVIAPIFFAVIPVWTGVQYEQWKSLTLSNGGLVHISFGAILGVAAWTRGQGDMMRAKIASDKLNSEP
jgi:hypothetical protein